MALYSVEEVEALGIGRGLPQGRLSEVLDECEALIVKAAGPNYADSTDETYTAYVSGAIIIPIPRRCQSISAITVDGLPVPADTYRLEHRRLARRTSGVWTGTVVITYRPVDDTPIRRIAQLQLIRLHPAIVDSAARTRSEGEVNESLRSWHYEVPRILAGVAAPLPG